MWEGTDNQFTCLHTSALGSFYTVTNLRLYLSLSIRQFNPHSSPWPIMADMKNIHVI